MKAALHSPLHTPFGLAGIFDNVRDGLILVRYPRRDVVLFNRAAAEMTGLTANQVLGHPVDRLFSDRAVYATMRRCSQSPVGEWPGHFQDVLQTRFRGPRHDDGVELHFCRVDPPDLAGPLVLLVMRPFSEVQLETLLRHYSRDLRSDRRPRRTTARKPARPKAAARKPARVKAAARKPARSKPAARKARA